MGPISTLGQTTRPHPVRIRGHKCSHTNPLTHTITHKPTHTHAHAHKPTITHEPTNTHIHTLTNTQTHTHNQSRKYSGHQFNWKSKTICKHAQNSDKGPTRPHVQIGRSRDARRASFQMVNGHNAHTIAHSWQAHTYTNTPQCLYPFTACHTHTLY